jgi:transcriptional regulator with XRE-family HTH domain
MSTDLSNRLRSLRKERGLSQEAVARRADIGLRAYGDLERGRASDPHYSTLEGVAQALGTTVAELVGEEAAVPLAKASETGPQKSAARSAAEGQLTIHRTMEDLEKNLTPEQVREILAGILDGRITVEVARQLVKGAL